MGTRTVALGVLLLAAGVATWFALAGGDDEQGSVTPAGPAPGSRPSEGDAARSGEALRTPLEPAQSPPEPPPPETSPVVEPVAPPSPLARELDTVGATFLGEEPHVAELLELIAALAAVAVVDPGSVQVLRDDDGAPKVVRGALSAGDVAATFVLEEGLFRIQIPAVVAAPPWSRRDLQISFGEASGSAASCRAVVQFHPDPAESAAARLRPDEEGLIGWMLSVSPDTGTEIRPMSVSASGAEWRIGSRREGEVRELPWISNTASFDAWLRVLQPHAGK